MRKTNSPIKSSKRPTQFSAGRQRLLFALLTFSSLTSGAALAANGSLPTGGHFVGGNGAITQGGNHLSVSQSSQTGIINWQSFSIGKGDSVTIANGKGVTLNRVTGGNISTIAGSLKSTGSVYVVNQAGIVVGPSGKVVTNGTFVASTRDVSNATFMAGGNVDLSGSSSGTVVNQGSITSADGNVVLVGKSVTNNGSVSAAKGSASLVAGDNVLLQASGDDAVLVETGSGNVANSGTVEAAQVALNAAGGNVYALAVNNGGVIRATGTATKDGRVYLTAGDDLTVNSAVVASNADGSGGTIVATASTVTVRGKSRISANGTGNAAGGTVLIGGDRHGGTDPSVALSKTAIANAKVTMVSAGARISANGSAHGDGGNVVVWSEEGTGYAGAISAQAGARGGNGGFVEVSGKEQLSFTGKVNTSARRGSNGTLLLDPSDVTISTTTTNTDQSGGNFNPSSGATSSTIAASAITTALVNNDVVVTTTSTGGSNGNITVGAPIAWTANHSLSLIADGRISFVDLTDTITAGGSGNITLSAAGGGVSNQGGTAINVVANISAAGGTITLVAPTTVPPGNGITDPTATGFGIGFLGYQIIVSNGTAITNTQANGAGKIVLQADQVRLGSGPSPAATVTTPGEVDIMPTSPGTVYLGDTTANGTYFSLGNIALITGEDVKNVTANLLVIGSTSTTDLILTNPSVESAPVFDAVGAQNLKLLTGPTGSVSQDANTPIVVNDISPNPAPTLAIGTGGLAVSTGGAITLDNPYNSVGTIAFLQTGAGAAGGNISFTRQGGDAAEGGTDLIVGTVGGIGGITALGSTSTVTLTANETNNSVFSGAVAGPLVVTQASGAANAITAGTLDLEGPASSFTLNNTSNSVGRVSGNVLSVFLFDSTALTQTNGTTLAAAGTGTGSTNAAVQIVDASAITLNTGSSINDSSGGDIQLETNTKFSSSATDANTLSATGGGVWRVYSQSPLTSGESKGALVDNYIEYHAINSSSSPFTATIDGTGNGFLYTFQPTVIGSVTATRAYDGTTTAASGILVFGAPTGVVAGDTVTLNTGSSGTFNSKNVATATTVSVGGTTITTETAQNPNGDTIQVYNYAVNPNATGAGTITPIPLTITANDASKTYGQTLTFAGTEFTNGASQLIGTESVTSVTLTSPGAVATANVGSYAITPSAAVGTHGFLASNYTIDYVNGSLTIGKAALTFTPKAVSVAYDGSTLNNTTYSDILSNYTISGFQNSDTAGNSGLSLSGSMAFQGSIGTAVKNAATYSQAVGTLSLSSTNYTLSFSNPTPNNYVITPKALTVTPDAVSVVYDGTTLNNTTYSDNTGNYSISGFVGSDTLGNSGVTLTGSMAFNGSTTQAVRNAATYSQAVGTLGLTSTNGNYSLSFSNPTPNNYVITPKALTVTPDAVSVAYNGTTLNNTTYSDNTGNYSITGFVGTDTLGNSGLALTGSMAFNGSTTQAVKNAATYSQAAGTLGLTTTNGNYSLSFSNPTPNNYVITPIALTLTPKAVSVVYDGTALNKTTYSDNTGNYSISGFVGSDTLGNSGVTLTGSMAFNGSTGTAVKNVATYSQAVGTLGLTSSNGNYTLSFTNPTPNNYVITPKALTVTPDAVSVVYNGTTLNNTTYSDNTGNYSITGFVGSDTLGNSGVTLTGSMAFNNATGTAVKNAGTYSQKVGTLDLTTTNGNYSLSFSNPTPNNYVITPVALMITASDQTKTYGQTGSLGTTAFMTGSGLVGGETISSVTLSSTGTPATANTGDYAIGISNATGAGGFLASNYNITYTPGTLTVNPAVLTVTPVAVSKVYDGSTLNNTAYSDNTANYTITGFVNGQNLSTAVIGLTGSMAFDGSTSTVVKNAATYTQTVGSLGLTSNHGNYTLNFSNPHPNNYVITPMDVTVADLQGTRVYDGGTDANGSILTITDLAAGDQVTVTGNGILASKNVGKEQITGLGTLALGGADAGNYTLEAANPNDFVIVTKATLTISAVTQTKVYNGTTTSTMTPTVVGLQTGDHTTGSIDQSYGSRNVLGTDGSTLSVLNQPGIGVSDGNGGGNYIIVYKTAKGTITPEHVTVTATPNTKTFDGTETATATPTVTSGRIFDPDTGTFTESYGTKHAGVGLTLTPTGSISDGNDGKNYIVTYVPISGANPGPGGKAGIITPAPLTISAVTQTKTYDGTTTSTDTPIYTGTLYDGDTLTGLSQAYNSKNALGRNGSTLSVNPNYVLTDATDYAVTLKTAPGTITPLVITATGMRVYNGTPDVDGSILTITDLLPGDDVGLTGTGTSSSPHVGKHNITGGLTLTGADAGDYTLTGGKETVKITPFAVVLTGTRVYDGATDGDSGILSVTNAFAGDTVTVDTGTSTIVSRNVGNEKIVDFGTLTLGGASAGDYTLVGAKGNVIVTPELLTVTAVPGTKTYDGTTTSTGKPIVTTGTVFGPDTGTFIQTYGTKHAGTGLTLTPSGSVDDGNGGKNYIITFVPVTTGVIDPLPVILAGTRVYNGGTDANSTILMVTNLIPGDMVTVSGSGVLSSPDVGPEPIVGFNGLTLGGSSSGDYTLVGAIGTVQVTPLSPPPPPPPPPVAPPNPSLQVPNQTASGDGTQVNFSVFSGGLVTLAPQQNGVVTGTIATIDGTDYQPDSQLGCTLGAAGCIQNGVAPTTTSVPQQ